MRRGFGVRPGEQIVDVTGAMAVDDACEHADEIGLRIDAAELASLEERGDYSSGCP